MGELDQLKKRINDSGVEGVPTEHIREDYAPAGNMMIHSLTLSGGYVQRKAPAHSMKAVWKIFQNGCQPY